MYLAGQPGGFGTTDIYSASLAMGMPLSATGWKLTRGTKGELVPVAGRQHSRAWDGNGGRHCPSYARGWDPTKGRWVERIYYAGAADNLWGPYTIGFLEWNGEQWIDQPEPTFTANEDWEHGSVYEPNLVYHDGKWRCGTWPDRTTRIISFKATQRVMTGVPAGANTMSLLRRN